MPNPANVIAPISLFGFGRSGTSLLFDIFFRHPGVFAVGETAQIVFDIWESLEAALPNCRERVDESGMIEIAARCGESVRAVMLLEFPSAEPAWMHKPIGVPRSVQRKREAEGLEAAAAWHWSIVNNIFPQSKNLAIVRD